MLGEYNIGGDAFEIERILLELCGFTLVATFSGNSTVRSLQARPTPRTSTLVMCHRSINYVADMLETSKYGIPWIKVNFIGAEATAKSLAQHRQPTSTMPALTERVGGGHRRRSWPPDRGARPRCRHPL